MTSSPAQPRQHFFAVLPTALALLGLVAASGNFMLFHMVAELASIAVGVSIFLLIFHARTLAGNPALHVFGVSAFFAALLDLLHSLTFKGMNLLPGDADAPTQLWVAARGIQAAAVLAAPWLAKTRIRYQNVFWFFLTLTLGLMASIFWWKIFPTCSVEGQGLTPFKKTMEYLYVASFLAGAVFLRLNAQAFLPRTRNFLYGYMALMALAETLFTAYAGLYYDASNALGHLVKVAAYACAYTALAHAVFDAPLSCLFSSLSQREEELARQNAGLVQQARTIASVTRHPALTGGDLQNGSLLLVRTSLEALEGDRGGFWLFSPDGRTLSSQCILSRSDGQLPARIIQAGDHPEFFTLLDSGRVCATPEALSDPAFASFARAVFEREDPVAVMASGVRFRGRLAGMVCQARFSSGHAWRMDQQAFLGSMADLASLLLESHERDQDQRARKDSEKRLQALIQAIPDQVRYKNAAGRTLVANQAMLQAYGLKGGNLPGGDLAELASFMEAGPGRQVEADTDDLAWRTGQTAYCELHTDAKSDHSVLEVIKKVVASPGMESGLLVIRRDIASHRQSMAGLKAASTELETVYAEMFDGLILADPVRMRILKANPAFQAMFGRSQEELAAMDVWDLLAPGQHEAFVPLLARLAPERAVTLEDVHCLKADGSLFWMDVSLSRFSLSGSERILAVARDVTRRKQDEQALAARRFEVEKLNRDLEKRVRQAIEEVRQRDLMLVEQSRLAGMGEMIGNIAHQWRQPLNALGLLVANMAFDATSGQASREEIENSSRQCRDIIQAMSRTIDDFRNFFKPDKEKRRFTVRDAVLEALSLVEASLIQKRIGVDHVLDEQAVVEGYRGEFAQVILNLLANARDAVEATRRKDGRISLSCTRQGGTVTVRVADNGGGVDPALAQRIFEPYFTTKAGDKGTGLGLYMSKRIIEDHMAGRITQTNENGGAAFSVSLPAAPEVKGLEEKAS